MNKHTKETREARLLAARDRVNRVKNTLSLALEEYDLAKHRMVMNGEWDSYCEESGYVTYHTSSDLLA